MTCAGRWRRIWRSSSVSSTRQPLSKRMRAERAWRSGSNACISDGESSDARRPTSRRRRHIRPRARAGPTRLISSACASEAYAAGSSRSCLRSCSRRRSRPAWTPSSRRMRTMEVLLLYPVRSARRFVETPLACIHSASASPNVFCCSSIVFPPFLILILHDNLWNFNTYFL